jgi:hypothetical protein
MDKVRAFLKAAVGEEQIESYIKDDRWIEFPTRSLGDILEEYETLRKTAGHSDRQDTLTT